MAELNMLPDGMTINPSELLEYGGCPVSYWIEGRVAKLLAEKDVKGVISSYPIYKDGKTYPLEVEFDEDIVHYDAYVEGTSLWESGVGVAPKMKGYKVDYSFDLFDIVFPMVVRLKEEYDLRCDEYECWHSFEDLVIEDIYMDTDSMTIHMEMGS